MKIFKTLTVLLLLLSSAVYADVAKVVYDLTTSDVQKIKKHLIHSVTEVSKYYKSQNKEFKAIVVISGHAYQFFVEDLKTLRMLMTVNLKRFSQNLNLCLKSYRKNIM